MSSHRDPALLPPKATSPYRIRQILNRFTPQVRDKWRGTWSDMGGDFDRLEDAKEAIRSYEKWLELWEPKTPPQEIIHPYP